MLASGAITARQARETQALICRDERTRLVVALYDRHLSGDDDTTMMAINEISPPAGPWYAGFTPQAVRRWIIGRPSPWFAVNAAFKALLRRKGHDSGIVFRALACFRGRLTDNVSSLAPCKLADTPVRFEAQALRAVAARHAFIRRQNELSLQEFVLQNLEAVRPFDYGTVYQALACFRQVEKDLSDDEFSALCARPAPTRTG
ncbi:hypothetical protein HKX48_007852, partial [Thoreauomyces humboldtii]